jgi:hypothetical protein
VEPTYKTRIDTHHTVGVTVNADYKHSRVKQYLKDGRALRIETVINHPGDLICQRRLQHLDQLQAKASDVNRRLLDTERVGQGCVLASPAFERVAQSTLTEDGRRSPAPVRRSSGHGPARRPVCRPQRPRIHQPEPSRPGVPSARQAYTVNQMSYDLARLRLNGLIERREHTNTYDLTPDGQ